MDKFSHYSFRQYDNKVFAVTEHYAPGKSYTFGVIWSRERCAVIDPGLGLFGDMRKYIEGFTGFEKAIFTVSTCGGPQAVGAAGLFDETFVTGEDLELARESMKPEARLAVLKKLTESPEVLAEASGENIVDNSRVDLYDFHDSRFLRSPGSFDHFHLGGIHLGGEPLPGYTTGSMVVSVHGDDTVNCMFCGKSVSPHTNYLQNLDRAGLEKYRECLKELIDKAIGYTKFPVKKVSTMYLFSADCDGQPFYIETLEKILKGVDEILAGKTAGDCPAVYEGKNVKMHYAGSAVILYDAAL